MALLRILAPAAFVWALAVLIAQACAARSDRDLSVASGTAARGRRYFFTTAMLPGRKESVRYHPLSFAIGTVMHAGLLIALAGVIVLALDPIRGARALASMRPLFAAALLSALALLIRRGATRDLRRMSTPDDYVAICASAGLLLALTSLGAHGGSKTIILAYATLLFIYLPLGKLRHAAFFFMARGDLGARLGRRNVFPPPAPARGEP